MKKKNLKLERKLGLTFGGNQLPFKCSNTMRRQRSKRFGQSQAANTFLRLLTDPKWKEKSGRHWRFFSRPFILLGACEFVRRADDWKKRMKNYLIAKFTTAMISTWTGQHPKRKKMHVAATTRLACRCNKTLTKTEKPKKSLGNVWLALRSPSVIEGFLPRSCGLAHSDVDATNCWLRRKKKIRAKKQKAREWMAGGWDTLGFYSLAWNKMVKIYWGIIFLWLI